MIPVRLVPGYPGSGLLKPQEHPVEHLRGNPAVKRVCCIG